MLSRSIILHLNGYWVGSIAVRSVSFFWFCREKHELKERIMAGIADVNRHPVIHTWSYKLADAAWYDSKQGNADLVLGDGWKVRPVRPDDEPLILDLLQHVSTEDLRLRFFDSIKEFSHPFLARLTQFDFAHAMACPTKPAVMSWALSGFTPTRRVRAASMRSCWDRIWRAADWGGPTHRASLRPARPMVRQRQARLATAAGS
jgi:hypothetical protein